MNEQEQLGSEILDALMSAESVVAKLVHEKEQLQAQLKGINHNALGTLEYIDRMPSGEPANPVFSLCVFARDMHDELEKLRWRPVEEGLPVQHSSKRIKYWVITPNGPAVDVYRRYANGWDWSRNAGEVLLWQPIILPGE